MASAKRKGTLFGKPRGEVIRHPGALRRAAKRAGMSTAAYARKHRHDAGKTGKRARLAIAFATMRKAKRGAKRSRRRTARR